MNRAGHTARPPWRLVARIHDKWQSSKTLGARDRLDERDIAKLLDRVEALRQSAGQVAGDRQLAHIGLSRFVLSSTKPLGGRHSRLAIDPDIDRRGVRGPCVATEV